MKRKDMKHGTTYLLCPEKECGLFHKNPDECEYNCPFKNRLRKLFLCPFCEEIADLPGRHTPCQYPNHNVSGCDALIKRMGFKYLLIFEMPED